MSIEKAYDLLAAGTVIILVVLALLCLIRCIRGPRVSDRVIAVNMVSTQTIVLAAVFVIALGEGYLADIALVYAMLSFLAVVVLSKVYTGIYRERKHEEELLAQEKHGEGDAE